MIISDRPDPPDALVEIDQNRSWIEITDAFLNGEHARSLTSYAADDTEHIPPTNTFTIEPDKTLVLKS